MTFSGWPAEALDFYDGLAADNSKTYWTAHKVVYDELVLGPMVELVEELAAMVAWLSSEDCSFSTGAVFDVSGGRATY